MIHHQPTLAELQTALEAANVPSQERFERMIRRGIINAEGRLTKLFGGEAEPEAVAAGPTLSPGSASEAHQPE